MLTPDTIRSREFLVALRGYDREEVQAFLYEVADAFSALSGDQAAPAGSGGTGPGATTENSLFAEVGVQTQRILDAAQAAGQEIRRRAQVQADTTVQEAVEEAQREVDRLRELATATHHQIDMMEQRRAELAQVLRQARETADLALLEVEADIVQTDAPDPSNSVLAAQAEQEEGSTEPETAVSEQA